MTYIGIDPGKSGSLALITDEDIAIYPYDEQVYCGVLQSICMDDCICAIEQVHSMPRQGVKSTFEFGKNFGFLLGMLTAYGIPYQEVKPQVWKKEFALNKDKADSISTAHHLFPKTSLRKTTRCTTDHDGMAESLLLAEYARRKFK